jgi:hypothetical protein
MRRTPWPALVAIALLPACTTHIEGVRLESVRPATAADLPAVSTSRDAHRWGGVIVGFASERDLRREIARSTADVPWLIVEPCAARRPDRTGRDDDRRLLTGPLFDELGELLWAGRRMATGFIEPSEGVRFDGVYRFRAQIGRVTFARDQPVRDGFVVRSIIRHDLGRDEVDLRATVMAWNPFGRNLRTNTVVIPHALIRAALDAAPEPATSPTPPAARAPAHQAPTTRRGNHGASLPPLPFPDSSEPNAFDRMLGQ